MLFSTSPQSPATPTSRRGLFIVLYGINNIGKSTQAKLLVEKMHARGLQAEYVKYPLYDVPPSGILLNDFLRTGNFYNLSAREAQIIYTLNRQQYEPLLLQKLAAGVHIIAEDYTGTGLAWGMGNGVNESFLTFLNSHLAKEDVAIMMDGERFLNSREAGHHHETNDALASRVRVIHQELARKNHWHTVDANRPIPAVHKAIWRIIQPRLQQIPPRPVPRTPAATIRRINGPVSAPAAPATPQLLDHASERTPFTTAASPPPTEPLRVKRLSPTATMPKRAHATDAGLDLYSDGYYTLYPGQRARITTGIACAIPDGHAGLIWDKSGLAARGLKTSGGVIDAGYRGEIQVVITNLSNDIIEIDRGHKIAQLVIQEIKTPTCQEVSEIDTTERNEGSFGSTGR